MNQSFSLDRSGFQYYLILFILIFWLLLFLNFIKPQFLIEIFFLSISLFPIISPLQFIKIPGFVF